MNSSTLSDSQPTGAVAQAQRLRVIATVIRRLAGGLTYFPTMGERPAPPAELLPALEELQLVVSEIQQGAEGRAQEEEAVAATGDTRAEPLRAGHAAVDQGGQVVLAALNVLCGLLTSHDGASLDAPYGLGSPVRVHPGAMCTIVAERAEHLARELETAAIIKANVARGVRSVRPA